MIKYIKKYFKYRNTYNELAQLSDRELADLGINRADIHYISRQVTSGNMEYERYR